MIAGGSRRNWLLAALGPAESLLLDPHLHSVTLAQGALLYEQGEDIEQVYFPHSGIVALLAVMPNGDAIETATVGRSGVVGAMAAIGLRRAFARAIVQVRGSGSRIAAAHLRKAAVESSHLRDLIIRYHEILLMQVQQTAACNALHDVEARLCRWMLQIGDRIDDDTIPLTQEFLSQMLGVQRTTVTEAARSLQEAGLLRYRRGQIEILDRKRLEKAACECYGVMKRQIDLLLPRTKE